MAILSQNSDYTDKDFDSLRARMFNLIAGVFPTWTAQQVANFGNIMVDLFSFTGDVLFKYQDNQAGDSRIVTATQRKNLIALVKLIGYEPSTATASQVDATLSIPSAVAGDVVIPSGTVVRTKNVSDPIKFRLLLNATIPAGSTSVSGQTSENAELEQDSFTSPGTPNLSLILGTVPYIDTTTVISAGNGVYTEVDNFLSTTGTDRHFTVTVDQNDQATVRFGDGSTGVIPTGTITVDYKVGGGASGQVEANTVQVIEGTFTDAFGTTVQVSVNNPSESTPAANRQTVEQIRQAAPESIRVLNRTVAREDYEINAKKLPEVARALMLTSNEDTSIGENTGFLFVIPVGGGLPTADLKAQVLTQVTVTFPNTLTFNVTVSDPVLNAVDIRTVVFLSKGAIAANVDAAIRSNLASFFDILNSDGTQNESIDFGFNFVETEGAPNGELPKSKVRNVVNDTAGVLKLGDGASDFTMNGETTDISLLLREFPTLGTVTIINGSTGTDLV